MVNRIEASQASNYSQLDPIDSVLVAAPGAEAVLGLAIDPAISLFEAIAPAEASVVAARADHDHMTAEFENNGICAYNMRSIIGQELAKLPQPFEAPEQLLAELKNRLAKLHGHYNLGDMPRMEAELEELIRDDVQRLGPDAAVALNAVLTNCADLQGNYKPFDLSKPPAANFMFWRDTNHITGDELVTHRMFWPIRDQEVALAEMGLQALGLVYKSIGLSREQGSIEGGDVMPMELGGERYALIGNAERTSWSAVEKWFELHEALFSVSGEGLIPAVIEGPHSNTQDEMHIDTFASQIAPGVLIHCGEITRNREFSILTRRHGEIIKVAPETFEEWIQRESTTSYDMTLADQRAYAPNVLTDGGRGVVYITREGTPDVTNFIKSVVPKVVELKMNHITNMYGGAHCLTSEIRKS